MPYEIKTIGFALQKADPRKAEFFIPAMQRPYVWKKKDLIKLFESIYLGYPIGTSLIWRTKYNNPRNLGAARVYWVHQNYHDNMQATQVHLNEGEEITLMLDGQQRLTSLNIGVRGEWIESEQERYKLCFAPNATEDVTTRSNTLELFKFINFDREDVGNLIPCGNILKWEHDAAFEQFLFNYLNLNRHSFIVDESIIESRIRQLRKSFWTTDAYCYGVYQASTIEEALEVFILANDTGEKLDKTDLILATLQISWERLSPREIVPQLVRTLNAFYTNRPFDQKKLLNLFFLTSPCNIKASYKISEFTPDIINQLELYWPKFVNNVIALHNQIVRWGLHAIGRVSTNALIPILKWVNNNQIDFTAENNHSRVEIERCRKSLIAMLFSGAFGGNSTSTITATRKVIDEHSDGSYPFEQMHETLETHHTHSLLTQVGITDFLNGLRYERDNVYIRLILMLIKGNLNGTDYTYQLDHIFPRANNEPVYGDRVHSIANIQLLTDGENNIKNNNNPAILWRDELFNTEWRRNNQLPEDIEVLEHRAIYDDAERLWENRKQKIINLVCAALYVSD